MINVRAFYHKKGRAKYISHLDISRCMQRAFKRAGLPVWYTEGFNPHIYLTFALPLSLGYESECEVMDFRLLEERPLEEVRRRLDETLPPDITVVKVAEQLHKPDTIVSALYDITLSANQIEGGALKAAFLSFWESGAIEVEKRTKKGNVRVDIRPDCKLLSLEEMPDGIFLRLETAAGSVKNINPTLLTDEFLRRQSISDADTQVMRKVLLMADGKEFE